MTLFVVAIGGALGACTRFAVIQWFARTARPFYIATFVVNSVGSLLMGMALHLLESSVAFAFLALGFLGAFTTFSTFAFDAVRLMRTSRLQALVYVLLTMVISFGCIVLGFKIR
jgi:CrcB protein